jgi:phosphoribosylglycinamide formyltransferase-1
MGTLVARLRLGVLISGRGSNMQALIDAAADSSYPAEIGIVISNVPDAGGLALAAARGIPTTVIDSRPFRDRRHFEDALDGALREANVGLVCLAGFMRLLTEHFVGQWWDRLVNIHPSLLPAFPGLHVHEAVLASGTRFTGCTVHFVRPGMDDGPIIIQAAVPVHPDDNVERLAARVLEQEHRVYPAAVRLVAERRTETSADGRVHIHSARVPTGALINPSVD